MAISWSEAEEIHWCLGRVQMRKRGSDDSFSTTCINLTPSQVEDAEVQARRQQKQRQESEQGAETPRSGWSGEEETILFQCKRANMSWKSISALLPGRTIISCRDHYKRQCKLGPAWPQERQNEFCKQYESLKSSMWANIGEELNMSWEIAEGMHWRLGKAGMAERASLALSSQAAVEVVPPRARNAEVHQHRDQEHDPIQQSSRPPHLSPSQSELAPMTHEGKSGSSATLPSFAEITAGVEMLWRPPQRET
ncbi:hypothetical protein E4U11_001002 [Claviceps purpurea]|nr:hypothetical protein E4U11_001002 [Claviceps purpurea]